MIFAVKRILALYLAGALALTGCNLAKVAPLDANVVSGQTRVRLPVSPPPPTATLGVLASGQPEDEPRSTATTSQPRRCAEAEADRPARRVRADVQVDYETKSVAVAETLVFHNREPGALAEIVLDVQANQWEESFWLDELTVNGGAAAYELNLNRLVLALAAPLAPDCWLEIGLRFRLQLAEIRDGLRAYRGFLGYSSRQLNLGHFLPIAAARLNGDWRIHEPNGFGEQVVYDLADWQVTLSVDSAAPVVLAAPGSVDGVDPATWKIELLNARDFALSLSDAFIESVLELSGGPTFEVYTFADAQINANGLRLDGAEHVLEEAVKSLILFGKQFGAYERERIVIVQGDFPDGMEFTGLVFVGGAWFTHFDGGHKNYLTLISVHEIAHQWWYARVGSDAALNPWLDEALATYSEYLFIEEYYPADKNWWWTFRVAGFFPQGKVDSSVYEFSTARQYINAIYLRGVQMLHNLRVDIGDDAFFQVLRAYLAAGDGKIADPMLFWRQLPPEQRALTARTRSEYLRQWDDEALFGALERSD